MLLLTNYIFMTYDCFSFQNSVLTVVLLRVVIFTNKLIFRISQFLRFGRVQSQYISFLIIK